MAVAGVVEEEDLVVVVVVLAAEAIMVAMAIVVVVVAVDFPEAAIEVVATRGEDFLVLEAL